MAKFVTLLAEGLLRRELVMGAMLFSTFTIVVALNSTEMMWKIGYCVAGTLGIFGTFYTMLVNWRFQWLGSTGIVVANTILLIIHGRIS
ncbi:hypothetical protein ACFV24_02595 [Nocardia fluminea]|uniref:hypothetical protein n=1 Tax=Nocardia fluminea TaxID=134984 RepID=UPI003670AFBD